MIKLISKMQIAVLLVLSLSFFAASCVSNHQEKKETEAMSKTTIVFFENNTLSPSEKNVFELIKTTYDNSLLDTIKNYNGTLDEINASYPIECIRKSGYLYRVEYLGNSQIVSVFFDEFGQKVWAHKFFIQSDREAFEKLEVGDSLDKVRSIDPNGAYYFLHTGRNEPKYSEHYTRDGFLITVVYDGECKVSKIEYSLI